MNVWIGIATGGAVGAVLRHALVLVTGAEPGRGFPSGHFIANVAGSVAIGVLIALLVSRGLAPAWRGFFVTGVLGSFTTYSAFSLDTVLLVENGNWALAAGYVLATVLACLGGCWLGLAVGRAVF